jgi:hypothetical protein
VKKAVQRKCFSALVWVKSLWWRMPCDWVFYPVFSAAEGNLEVKVGMGPVPSYELKKSDFQTQLSLCGHG